MQGEDIPKNEGAGQEAEVLEQTPMGGFNPYDKEKFNRLVSVCAKRLHAPEMAEYHYLSYRLQNTMRGAILQQHIEDAARHLRAMMYHEDIEHGAPIVSISYDGGIEGSSGSLQKRDGRMTCIPGRAFIQVKPLARNGENQQPVEYQFVLEMPQRTMALSFASSNAQYVRGFHNILVRNIAAHHESISGGVHSAIYQWNILEKEKRKSVPLVGIIYENT